MQFDYLNEFMAVVDEGSMNKAAARLGISQSSLSRHIKSLESEFGMQLIRRGAGGVELTTDGSNIYNRASPMLDAAREIEAYVESRQTTGQPAAVGGLSDHPGLAHRLFDAYAKLGGRNSLRIASPESLGARSEREALESGEIMLWVTFSTDSHLPKDGERGLRVVELFHPRMMMIMEPTNPLAGNGSLSSADLDGQVFRKTESGYRRANESWNASKAIFDERGIRYRAVTVVFKTTNDWFVDFGRGLLPMSEGNRAIDMLRSFGKVVLPVDDLSYTFVGAYRKGDRLAERLIEECAEESEEGGETGEGD